MPIELSVCLIVKNEEKYLENCLKCVVQFADEIIIVDTGSTDLTVEIAKKYTDKVYYFEWIKDFSAARNFSFSKATRDYIMWLDADDTIRKSEIDKINDLKKNITEDKDFILMMYNYEFDKAGNVLIRQTRERIVKKSKGFYWIGAVHEMLNVSGNPLVTDIEIDHAVPDLLKLNSAIDRNNEILKREANSDNPPPYALVYYANMLLSQKNYTEAKIYLEIYFNMHQENTPMFFNACKYMYIIYMNLQKHDEAIAALTKCDKIAKDNSEYYCVLGLFYKKYRNDYIKAIEFLDKALDCKGNRMVTRNEDYYYYIPLKELGNCFYDLGDHKKTLMYYQVALSYNSSDEELLNIVYKLKKESRSKKI